MDYTSGIFDLENNVKRIATTLSRQLAYYVTIYSGMQMAADRPVFYEERFPEHYSFIKNVPTSFKKTVPIAGEIGEYYLVAREARDTNDWYIAGVTNEESRQVHLKLDFLAEGVYDSTIYRDSEDAHYRDNCFGAVIEHRKLSRYDALDIYLAPGGGFAIELIKV